MTTRLSPTNRLTVLAGLGSLGIAVACLRFNQWDPWIIGSLTGNAGTSKLGDADQYVQSFDYFRGDASSLPASPFGYRVLLPFIASLLPFGALTSLNLLNLLACAAIGPLCWFLAGELGAGHNQSTMCAVIATASFPTFYYGAIGYLDPALSALSLAALLAMMRRHWVVIPITVAAVLVRESALVIVAGWLIAELLHRARHQRNAAARQPQPWSLRINVAATVLALTTTALVRLAINLPSDDTWPWVPSIDRITANLSRPRPWLIVGLMLPSLAAARFVALQFDNDHQADHGNSESNRTLALGFLIASLFLFALATSTAYLDGRFAWSALVLSILLIGSRTPHPERHARPARHRHRHPALRNHLTPHGWND